MFDFVDSSIMGGICIASQNIANNDDGKSTISSCDVCSFYPYIMSKIYLFLIINLFRILIKINMDDIKTIHVC